ncbi:MAG: hypothetical protein CM1200mP41_07260 [Gammaproteobacteria bacterium]|nr:MAG: hypothetical protein CM1200mP41_07260 [Gammaproteobacteria bacterium]
MTRNLVSLLADDFKLRALHRGTIKRYDEFPGPDEGGHANGGVENRALHFRLQDAVLARYDFTCAIQYFWTFLSRRRPFGSVHSQPGYGSLWGHWSS